MTFISRVTAIRRPMRSLLQGRNVVQMTKRNAGAWQYRSQEPSDSKFSNRAATIAGAVMWWWILWHFWHEPGHVFGHGPYLPDPSKWTDEELGIPPIDED